MGKLIVIVLSPNAILMISHHVACRLCVALDEDEAGGLFSSLRGRPRSVVVVHAVLVSSLMKRCFL